MSDITNKQMVAVRGEKIIVLHPAREMTKNEAMVHAAWLLALACDGTFTEWDDILGKVLNS